jgi:glycosyltransferase involved in cell wall biosynthesis
MKILHVITTLDVGGAEMHLLTQVRGQCARGHQVRVAYLKGEGRLADDFREAGAAAILPVGSGLFSLFKLFGPIGWADIIHSHLLKADAMTAVAVTLRCKRSHAISGKHNDERALLNPWVSRIHGILGNLPVRTIALSDHVGRFVQEHGRVQARRMRRVYYGIDPTPWEAAGDDRIEGADRREVLAEFGFPDDAIIFTCVARFAPQKAHEVLLQALHQARQDPAVGSRIRLLLVGDDPFGDGRQRAEAEANRLDLGDACVFAGIRRDVPRLLAASDVFAMASRWEGLGLVFLEAMAVGLPVLSTHVSAIPEVVIQGVTGRLVPPDDVPALASGMLELAGNSELCDTWGQAGRARVREDFGLDRMVDETLAIYAEVLGGLG